MIPPCEQHAPIQPQSQFPSASQDDSTHFLQDPSISAESVSLTALSPRTENPNLCIAVNPVSIDPGVSTLPESTITLAAPGPSSSATATPSVNPGPRGTASNKEFLGLLQRVCRHFCAAVPPMPIVTSANGTLFRDYNAWNGRLIAPDYGDAWVELVDFIRRCTEGDAPMRRKLQHDVTRLVVEQKVRERNCPDQQKAPSTASLRQARLERGKVTFHAVLDLIVTLQDLKHRFIRHAGRNLSESARFAADVDIARAAGHFIEKLASVRTNNRIANISVITSGDWSRKFLGTGFEDLLPDLNNIVRRIVRRAIPLPCLETVHTGSRLPENPTDPGWADPVVHAIMLIKMGDFARARLILDLLKRPIDPCLQDTLPENERLRISFCELAIDWTRARPGFSFEPQEIMQYFEQLVEVKEWPDEWSCNAETLESLLAYSERENFAALCALANACIFRNGQPNNPNDCQSLSEKSDWAERDDDIGYLSSRVEGWDLLKKSYDQGDATAHLDMISLLFEDLEQRSNSATDVTVGVQKIVECYKAGVERQCPSSFAGLGKLYEAGFDGVLRADAALAGQYYRMGLSAGLEAPFCLAELLEHGGPGVDRDVEEALAWYRAAHRRGHLDAGVQFAALKLEKSQKTKRKPLESDVEVVVEVLKESVLLGSVDAMHYLATLYHEGAPGLAVNLDEARKLYAWAFAMQQRDTPGAKRNHCFPSDSCCDHSCRKSKQPSESGCRCATSLFNLAQIEFDDENYDQAARLYMLARERGCVAATENLASLITQGISPHGCDPDDAGLFAKELYEEVLAASVEDDIMSSTLCNYGDLLHSGGPGLPPDKALAAVYYERHFNHPETRVTWITLEDCVWYVEVSGETQQSLFLNAMREGLIRSRDDLIWAIDSNTIAMHSRTLPDGNGMYKYAKQLLWEKYDIFI